MHLNKSKIVTSLAATALGVGLVTSAVAGANLLKNGKFNGSTNFWSGPAGTTTLTIDAGRLKVANTAVTVGYSNAWAQQCAPVEPGRSYQFGVDVFEPSGQPRSSNAYVEVAYFAGPDCAGALVGADNTDVVPKDEWTRLAMSLEAPAGAQSVRIDLMAVKGAADAGEAADGVTYALFDNATLKQLGGGKPAK